MKLEKNSVNIVINLGVKSNNKNNSSESWIYTAIVFIVILI